MSATFVHPAATLPIFLLSRRRLPLSALAVGSMSPDFGYVLNWSGRDTFAHSLPGLAFCVPAALAALWLFHAVAKRPLLELLPDSHRRRLLPLAGEFPWWPWTRLAAIVLAVALGALTHLAWDSFTHYGGWGTKLLPALNCVIFQAGALQVTGYNLLQHEGTLIGGAMLAAGYWLWAREAPALEGAPPPALPVRARLSIWAGFVLVPLAVGLLSGFAARGRHRGAYGFKLLTAKAGIVSHFCLAAMVLLFGAAFLLWQRRRSASQAEKPQMDTDAHRPDL